MEALFLSKYRKQLKGFIALSLMLICLIGTHWIGFAHGISHSGLGNQSTELSCVDQPSNIQHSSASCHLYDALTLAGFVASSPATFFIPVQFGTPNFALDQSALPRIQAGLYQSRAPPFFTL